MTFKPKREAAGPVLGCVRADAWAPRGDPCAPAVRGERGRLAVSTRIHPQSGGQGWPQGGAVGHRPRPSAAVLAESRGHRHPGQQRPASWAGPRPGGWVLRPVGHPVSPPAECRPPGRQVQLPLPPRGRTGTESSGGSSAPDLPHPKRELAFPHPRPPMADCWVNTAPSCRPSHGVSSCSTVGASVSGN